MAEISSPTPVLETEHSNKKMLNAEMASRQASLLLNGEETIDRTTLEAIAQGEKPNTEKVTKDSHEERASYWETKDTEGKTPMELWERQMNDFLNQYKETPQEAFFKSIGIDLENGDSAKDMYQKFMREQKGDIGFFADQIARNNTAEAIEQHASIIKFLGAMYGEKSTEIAKLITEGIKNAQTDVDTFIDLATQQRQHINPEPQQVEPEANKGDDTEETPLSTQSKQPEEQKKEKTTKNHRKDKRRSRNRTQPPRYLKTKAAVRGLIAGTAISTIGVGAYSEVNYDDPTALFKESIGYYTGHEPHTDQKLIDAISQKLNIPDQPKITSLLMGGDSKNESNNDSVATLLIKKHQGDESWLNAYKNFVAKQAEEYDLTVIDTEPYKERIKHVTSLEEALTVLNDFSSHYGFSINLDGAKLDMKELKQGAQKLIDDFSTIPTELIKLSGIKEMKLVPNNKDYGGKYLHLENTVLITESSFINHPDLYSHEFGHGIDKKLSGGKSSMDRDSEFKQANPSEFNYKDDTNTIANLKINMEDYGETNAMEDKATFYERLLDGISPEMLNTDAPTVKEKRDILLARLEAKIPHITDYLRSISSNVNPETS